MAWGADTDEEPRERIVLPEPTRLRPPVLPPRTPDGFRVGIRPP